MEDDEIEVVDSVTDDEKVDDYLNEMLTESQPIEENEPEFDKNREGVTGDEWKDEEAKRLAKEIKEENKRNAERRIRNKKKALKENEDEEDEIDENEDETDNEEDNLDTLELDVVRERYEDLSQKMSIAEPVMNYLAHNKIGAEELQLGVDFVNRWRTDRVGAVKVLVESLKREGFDVGDILTHDNTEFRIQNEVDQRTRMMAEQQQAMQREAESRKVLDGFLDKHPDAWEHLEEITQVMQKSGIPDPYDAYFRLRRAYKNNGVTWVERQVNDRFDEEDEPEVLSPSAEPYGNYQPQRFGSIRDVVSSEARRYFRR